MCFAALHHGPAPLLLPNAWDVASAVALADAGFEAVGTTSLGVTAAAGLLDGVRAGRALTATLAARLMERVDEPVTVDLEDGFSDDPDEVAALAAHLAGLGVAGINLEDGRPDGTLRDARAPVAVIEAVVRATPELFVNARTDVYWLGVGPQDERRPATVDRLAAYGEEGVSGVFAPGLLDLDDVAHVAAAVAVPLNVLWRPGVSLERLGEAGVARVSTGSALYRHALGAGVAAARAAREGGDPGPAPVSYTDLQDLLRVPTPLVREPDTP
ncbi:isocitrate lyase/phosphoenolpyruvate mutase family protein [Actinotalea sp. AC32]|nr:isocitrate lyase/phosphoenolpyruvate mutase family protein [Actinotalea sp. AC32]